MVPLAYTLKDRKVTKAFSPNLSGWPGNLQAGFSVDFRSDLAVHAENKARAKLVEALGSSSMWAVNIAEAKKSLGLITGPVAGFITCVRKIRRFDFVGATREFNRLHESLRLRTRRNLQPVSVPKGLRATPKAFANNWLAFHFGWEPLIQDIGAGIETLSKPYPPRKIYGKGSHRAVEAYYSNPGQFWTYQTYDISSKCKTGCTIRVDNPNAFIAQQLGFANPLSIAWELVPFSFVVDWFTNVGQILGQFSEFAGLSLSETYKTHFQVVKGTDTWYYGQTQSKEGVHVQRSLSIATATLRPRPWKGVSVTRGATAISLLVQLMGGKSYR